MKWQFFTNLGAKIQIIRFLLKMVDFVTKTEIVHEFVVFGQKIESTAMSEKIDSPYNMH